MIACASPAPAPKKSEAMTTGQMFMLVGEIGYLIAIPAVLFGFGGAYLDGVLDTSPFLVFTGLALSLLSSSLAVWHRIKPFLRS